MSSWIKVWLIWPKKVKNKSMAPKTMGVTKRKKSPIKIGHIIISRRWKIQFWVWAWIFGDMVVTLEFLFRQVGHVTKQWVGVSPTKPKFWKNNGWRLVCVFHFSYGLHWISQMVFEWEILNFPINFNIKKKKKGKWKRNSPFEFILNLAFEVK